MQVPTTPNCIWTRDEFDRTVERFMGEEVLAMIQSGSGRLAIQCELPVLRELVIYNMALHAPSAGNA